MSSPPRRAALAFIFVTVLLDVLALGVIIPVLPKLVEDFVGGDTAKSAKIYGAFGTVFAVMQFFFSPIVGSLSDRFGRRRVILLSNFGLGFDYVVMALSPTWQWLFLGRAISGITAASIPAAYAYIADVTPPEKRAQGYGMLGAAFGIGFVVGPAVGGLLGQADPRLPFWVAAGLSIANAMYGLFVLPESLSPEKRTPFSWGRANPIGSLKLLTRHPKLLGMASVNFLGYVAHAVLPSVFVLYASYRYQWNERTIGAVLGTVGIGSLIVQGALIRPVLKRFGERNTLLLGLAFGVAGFLGGGLAPTGPLFWATIPLMSLWGLSGPAAMSLLTALVGPSEQGQLQGANNGLRAISEILGPPLYTLPFAYFISEGTRWQMPGVPFIIAAVLLFASLALAVKVATGKRPEAVPVPVPALPDSP
jgi:MFS transporter, DHA1 family, tetracycline resistance protein